MTTAVVCGAGGFIGHHLARALVARGRRVIGIDVQWPPWSDVAGVTPVTMDLRFAGAMLRLLFDRQHVDEVYQLAADMGGMGFIHEHGYDCLHNNALINLSVCHAAAGAGVARYFFSSSVCVYRDMAPGEPAIDEDAAYPALCDNDYGWEKLYSERLALAAGATLPMTVRIARFQNCYGPEGAWHGGREKAPAALCRKAAEALPGADIPVWGDGTAVRNFIFIDDLVDGILTLMESDEGRPTNIGTDEYVTVDDLAYLAAGAADKRLGIRHVPGPVGVAARNFSNARMKALGWLPRVPLAEGIRRLYPWVAEQVFADARRGVPA